MSLMTTRRDESSWMIYSALCSVAVSRAAQSARPAAAAHPLILPGTPINRLPVMAKQVLDMYELYNKVVERGGLLEVIHKKAWQEIIKDLKLPTSITSAAFTLRTQYTRYLVSPPQ